VKEELLGSEAIQVAILDEALALWAVVVLAEVRKGALVETEGDTLTLDILLAHTGHDLRDVEVGALGPSSDHGFESVPQEEIIEGRLTSIIASPVKSPVDLKLEAVNHVFARLGFQVASLSIMQDLLDLLVLLLEVPLDGVECHLLGNDVLDSDSETNLMEPVVDQQLSVRHKVAGRVGSLLLPDDVDDTTRGRTDGTLRQVATEELSILDEDVLIIRAGPGFLVPGPLETDLRDDQGEDLLSCPEGLRLEDSWLWELVILVLRPHEKLHHKLLLNEGVPKREEHDT